MDGPILLARPLRSVSEVRLGAVVGFAYAFAKHDRAPIVVVTGIDSGASGRPLLEGLNVHYLSPRASIGVLERVARAPLTTSDAEKDPSLSGALRRYRTEGVKSPVIVDWRLFVSRVAALRDMDPRERASLMREVEARLVEAKSIPIASVLAERALALLTEVG